MKTKLLKLAILIALPVALLLSGCKAHLQPGGAYAPTDTNGVATAAPDLQLYQIDSAYKFAYGVADAIFSLEKQNRDLFWRISPDIKHKLDEVRPQAWQANVDFLAARRAYVANPTPPGLDLLSTLLSKMQAISASAQAVQSLISAPTPAK